MTVRPPTAWLDTLLGEAGLPPSTGVEELGGGTFNTVVRVATAGGEVVVKVAPDPRQPVLAYERDIMTTEAQYYRLAEEHGVTSVPRLLHHGRVDGVEALVLTVRPGRPWPSVAQRLDQSQQYAVRAEVGREIAALHRISGPGFGYPAAPLRSTWREAFVGMIDAVLADALRFGVRPARDAAEIAAIVDRVSPVLDEVPNPVLVHFDLWDGNILVDTAGGSPRLGGLIDAERAFWGDPLAELVSLRLFGDLEPDAGLLGGYRSAGGDLVLDPSARLRLALYRLYLYLIMWVESAPRGWNEDRMSWLRDQVLAPTAAILDSLDRERP